MEVLSAEDIERVFRVTDKLQIHRDWVILPVDCAPEGKERVMPDGNLLLHAPGRGSFEAWLAELPGRLRDLDLSRTRRADEEDPKQMLSSHWAPRWYGTRRYLEPDKAA
jgi:hypothetical protein